MYSFFERVSDLCLSVWHKLPDTLTIFFREGRVSLLQRLRSQTELTRLAVEQKRLDIQLQHANGLVDLALKIEKIEDSSLRNNVARAITTDQISIAISKKESDR